MADEAPDKVLTMLETERVGIGHAGPHVYGLWADGALVYLGKSTQVWRRIGEHMRAETGAGVTSVSLIPCGSVAEMERMETWLIARLRPARNLMKPGAGRGPEARRRAHRARRAAQGRPVRLPAQRPRVVTNPDVTRDAAKFAVDLVLAELRRAGRTEVRPGDFQGKDIGRSRPWVYGYLNSTLARRPGRAAIWELPG